MVAADTTFLLTPRQLEVLELMAKGLTNREIGGVLGISPGTARIHVSAVIRALDVTNRTEAAMALQDLRSNHSDSQMDPVPGFGERPTIAVLPFDELGPDPKARSFADGLVEDLTTRLAAYRWFPVIARNTAFTLRDSGLDVAALSRQLGARYVVEGSTRRSDDRVRIQVQLIDGESGVHVFAERFDRRIDDIFAVQDEIVDAIVGALEPTLLRVEGMRALRRPATSLSIWERVQRGMALVAGQGLHDASEAVAHFDAAIAGDPSFAPAHAGRAMALFATGVYRIGMSHAESSAGEDPNHALIEAVSLFQQAVRSGREATKLDPLDAAGWIGLGAALGVTGQGDQSLGALERALELNPSSPFASWSLAGVLAHTERWPETRALIQRAIRLSPRDPYLHHFEGSLAVAHLQADDLEDALAHARRSVEVEPEFPGISYQPVVVACLGLLGRAAEASKARSEMRRLFPRWNPELSRLLGSPAVVDRLLEGIRISEEGA